MVVAIAGSSKAAMAAVPVEIASVHFADLAGCCWFCRMLVNSRDTTDFAVLFKIKKIFRTAQHRGYNFVNHRIQFTL